MAPRQKTVSYVYDNADRVTSVTQPNGVLAEYGYDAASRLTALTYKKSGVTLGTLTYEYDDAGRRVKMGGSLAQTGLPSALTTTAYNAANHQTAFGANTLTYDLNGNLTGDGMKTYTWNARNQLTAISGGGVTASFSYDAFGRRISKTINSTTTGFLYDGANIVQEQAGGSATANMLTGGVDQFFSRTDASGTTSPLADALGSVVALTDASGAIQTQYSYEPFGKSSTSGTASSNLQKYTGREDDGTGLFYYRARYYSPDTQRFISEDPIGLAGGDINLFAYVGNSPVMATDPSGLEQFTYTLDSNNKIGIQNPQMGGRGKFDLDELQFLIDLFGMFPGIGEPFDLINAGISAGRGNYGDSASGLASAVPGIGMGATLAKWTRHAAFRAAKRHAGIPTSMQVSKIGPNFNKRDKIGPGLQYHFDVRQPRGGVRRITIRDDIAGHFYGPGSPDNRGSHFNTPDGTHFDYFRK